MYTGYKIQDNSWVLREKSGNGEKKGEEKTDNYTKYTKKYVKYTARAHGNCI